LLQDVEMANITVDDKTKVGFIASGKMAQAMAKGFISSGILLLVSVWASGSYSY